MAEPTIADKIARGIDVSIEAIYRADEAQRTLDRETAALKTTDGEERLRSFERIIRAALSGAGILLSDEIARLRGAPAPALEEVERLMHHAKNMSRAIRAAGDTLRGEMRELDGIRGGAVSEIHARLEQHGVVRVSAAESYSDAVGSLYSPLIVETPPPPRQPQAMTMTYSPESRTYGIDIRGISFTCGPGDFIDLKQTAAKTIHGRRCSVRPPCHSEKCTYYHDPRAGGDRFSPMRNIVLNYAVRLLSTVKDAESIRTDIRVRDMDYVRDLVQLGGIIFFKAEQVLAQHFSKKTIQRRPGGITRPLAAIGATPAAQSTTTSSAAARMPNML